jgi:hypothetical protein
VVANWFVIYLPFLMSRVTFTFNYTNTHTYGTME